MKRCWLLLALLATPAVARADAFDNYTNEILVKVPKAAWRPADQGTDGGTDRGPRGHPHGYLTAAFLVVVKTNEGRYSKLLVQIAAQKVPGGKSLPIILIERFVTYKEGEERTILVQGQNVRLFAEFQFNLDLGRVVPAAVGGDVECIAVLTARAALKAAGKAELYPRSRNRRRRRRRRSRTSW